MNTPYFLNLIMGNVFNTKITPALPTEYWLSVSQNEPTQSGSGDGEPSTGGTGYARVLLSDLSEPVDGLITNNATINFPESVTDWGTMRYYGVRDAAESGNLLFYNELSVERKVEPRTVLKIGPGELNITLKNPTPCPDEQ